MLTIAMPRLVALLIVAQFALAGAAHGYPTGLLLIPTADCLRSGRYCLNAEFDLNTSQYTNNFCFLNTQFSLLDRFEAGVDFELSGNYASGAFVNGKYVFAVCKPAGIAAAVGDYLSAGYADPAPYVVVSKRFQSVGLHLGMQRLLGTQRWFGGIDWAPNRNWTIMGDHTPGGVNLCSLGCQYNLSEDFNIAVGEYFAGAGTPSYFTVQVNIYGWFFGSPP